MPKYRQSEESLLTTQVAVSPQRADSLPTEQLTSRYDNGCDRKFSQINILSTSNGLLSHLPESQRIQFCQYGQGPKIKLSHTAIHHAVEDQARSHPDNIAVVCANESLSYKTLNYHANQLAQLLVDRGVGTGDTVPLFLERSTSMVIGILAILKTGAAYAPQHVGVAPDKQLSHVATTVGAKVVLTLSRFKDQVISCTDQPCVAIDEFTLSQSNTNKLGSSALRSDCAVTNKVNCSPQDLAMVLFTSGTTGIPNGVQITHQNLCNILLTSPGNLGIQPGTKVSQILSISFDMAAWEILGCLGNGGTLLIRGKDIAQTASRANVIIATPSVLSSIPESQCSEIHSVAVAGEPCPRELADRWSRVSRFYNSCGPTETTIVNTMLAHKESAETLSIGVPTPNNTVYILDKQGLPCKIGETGEMWAGGYAVSAGYLDNKELTDKRYRPDPFLGGDAIMFNTRDLGRWTKYGTLEHLGRTDDQVKIRGFRVELDSVSTILEAQPNCTRATVLKLDDRTLIGFMSPLGTDAEAAKYAVAAALPYYCVPKEIHILPKLPLTSRGKIDKRMLLQAAEFRRKHAGEKQALSSQVYVESGSAGTIEARRLTSGDSSWVQQKKTAERPLSDNSHQNTKADATDLQKTRLDKHALHNDARIARYQLTPLPDAPNTIAAKLTEHRFYHYWRLVAGLICANLAIAGYGMVFADWWAPGQIRVDLILNMAVANLTLAILIRQQYVINMLFKIATSTPLWAPLRFRQLMGKVYHFGGIHIGGAVCGTIWMIVSVITMFAVALFGNSANPPSAMTLFAASQLLFTLILLVVMALPAIRKKFHNHFELVHRLGGWFSLFIFWVVALSFINDNNRDSSYLTALFHSPVCWALVLVTFSIVLPWLRLKRVPVQFTKPSDHVVLANFDYGVTPFAGSSTTLSRSPLIEWHSFANVPTPGKTGFRLTISRAGDWTGQLIDDLPSHLWVKGIPTAGVGNVDQLFKRVVWVATGSGIGPTLPHLLAQEVPAHLIWSTRNARKTYGDDLVDDIVRVEPNALIWDTDKHGRPDLVQLAFAAVQDFDAEAVIVIANEKLTRLVVHNMEARGIPAYGAIWDS